MEVLVCVRLELGSFGYFRLFLFWVCLFGRGCVVFGLFVLFFYYVFVGFGVVGVGGSVMVVVRRFMVLVVGVFLCLWLLGFYIIG